MKKILIAGATGFIGKHLINYLLEKGYSVNALARSKQEVSKITHIQIYCILNGIFRVAILMKKRLKM